MEPVTVGMLATVAGIGTVGTIIVEAILRAARPSTDDKDRFGPLLALLVAVILGVVGQLATVNGGTGDIVLGILTGVIAGGTSMGIHDFVTGSVAGLVNGGGDTP